MDGGVLPQSQFDLGLPFTVISGFGYLYDYFCHLSGVWTEYFLGMLDWIP
jgi:hypothetical protein